MRLIAAGVFALFGGLVFLQHGTNREAPIPVVIEGNAISLPAGELSATSSAPAKSTGIAKTAPKSAGLVDINKATAEELEQLPDIGPSRAQEIVRDREVNGPFSSLKDLERVHGLGPKSLERLGPYLTMTVPAGTIPMAGPAPGPDSFASKPVMATATPTVAIRINSARLEELEALVGVGPKLAQRIIADRSINGPFRRPEDLLRVKGVGPKILQKNLHLLRFD